MFSLCLGVGDFLGLLIKAFDFYSPHTLTSPRILRFDINLRVLEIIRHGGKKSELCRLFVKCLGSRRNISLSVCGAESLSQHRVSLRSPSNLRLPLKPVKG